MYNEKITNNLLEVFEDIKPYKILVASSSWGRMTMVQILYQKDIYLIKNLKLLLGLWMGEKIFRTKIFTSEISNIDLKIVRPFNIYGERYKWVGDYSSAIPMLVKKIMDNDNPIYAWGSGNQKRSYMHAYDCARLMKEIMDNKIQNIVVNIGTKETISISELINKIVISGKTIVFLIKLNLREDLLKVPIPRFLKN